MVITRTSGTIRPMAIRDLGGKSFKKNGVPAGEQAQPVDTTKNPVVKSSEAPPLSDEASARRLIGRDQTLRASKSSSSSIAGQLVAPGVRILPPPAKTSEETIPTVEPSRAARPDLVPHRGSAPPPRQFVGLEGPALIRALRKTTDDKVNLGYRPAREAMFGTTDNNKGIVEGVYTGRKVKTQRIPSAQGENGMNTEHAWPQSKGVKGTPARYDLHHLFPSNAFANSKRGSFPFGEVVKGQRWEEAGSKLGRNAAGTVVFEPRAEKKGDIARALFYVSTMYELAMTEAEENVLRKWHDEDPPSEEELERNTLIAEFQGNRNPFVDDPSLVHRIERFDGGLNADRG